MGRHLLPYRMAVHRAVALLAVSLVFIDCDAACSDPGAEAAPLLFADNFESGHAGWEVLDPDTWTLSRRHGNTVFEITARHSAYKPPVRSPLHIALIGEKVVGNFTLRFRVRSTRDTGRHRDCCVFFGFQDPTHFYYAHLGAEPDRVSGQVLIVNGSPRTPLTRNEKPMGWDDRWHKVKLEREVEAGAIRVYWDDLQDPHLILQDSTFAWGRVGIGSFDDCNEFDDVELYGELIRP